MGFFFLWLWFFFFFFSFFSPSLLARGAMPWSNRTDLAARSGPVGSPAYGRCQRLWAPIYGPFVPRLYDFERIRRYQPAVLCVVTFLRQNQRRVLTPTHPTTHVYSKSVSLLHDNSSAGHRMSDELFLPVHVQAHRSRLGPQHSRGQMHGSADGTDIHVCQLRHDDLHRHYVFAPAGIIAHGQSATHARARGHLVHDNAGPDGNLRYHLQDHPCQYL